MDLSALETISNIAKSLDWSAWVTSIATLFLAALTFIYVRLTKKILEHQSDPCVILSVVHDDDRPSLLQLVAKNIGNGLAHDIKFEFSRPIPSRAWGLSEKEAIPAEEMKDGPLISGIPALGPGEERKISWGQYGGLIKSLGTEPVEVLAHFKKGGKSLAPVKCLLDVKSFDGTDAHECASRKIAKEIEKISSNLGYVVSGFRKLHVKLENESRSQKCD